ncbi:MULTISPECIES: hypothetical protein [unclassified Streptomyces]|uniref:hypothetical protein n=1 Tax=unclassified Streptomyces TaxID=2593676 RepID=UPI003809221D
MSEKGDPVDRHEHVGVRRPDRNLGAPARRRALAQSFQCWSKAAWTKVGSGVVGALPRLWPGTSRKKEMRPRCADWT